MSLAPKIIVADDDQALTRTLSWILKDNGYEVTTVPGGENLFDHLLSDQFDLLLLDLMLPKIDGWTVLEREGLLGPHIKPLLARLTALIDTADNPAEEVAKRIRILSLGARHVPLEHFQTIASALLRRQRVIIRYAARGTGHTTERELSPQRLIHYRDNWYLDAWCHLRDELRSFSVDAVQHVERLETTAEDIPDERLNDTLGAGYGIFSGEDVKWATLRFSPLRARWVASEKWHSKQIGRLFEDGSYELKVPYSNDPELLMDILKYGADCEVVGPEELRKRVAESLRQAAAKYADT